MRKARDECVRYFSILLCVELFSNLPLSPSETHDFPSHFPQSGFPGKLATGRGS